MVNLEDVTPESEFLAWWKCPVGHGYRMRVCDRIASAEAGVKNNCPICNIDNWTAYAEPGTSPIIDFFEIEDVEE